LAKPDADPDAIGRAVFLLTVVSALAFALSAYVLVS
jgi:hypothetical protein